MNKFKIKISFYSQSFLKISNYMAIYIYISFHINREKSDRKIDKLLQLLNTFLTIKSGTIDTIAQSNNSINIYIIYT